VATLTPLAIVVDRPTADAARSSISALGGAWQTMFEVWERSDYRYLVLFAHTEERLRCRAPLTCLADSDDSLREGLKTFCSELDDVTCRWVLCLEPKSAADGVARGEVLGDCIVEGHA
jgi:hypothetical protein